MGALIWQTEDVLSVGPLSQRGGVGVVTGSAPGHVTWGRGRRKAPGIPGPVLTAFCPLSAPFRRSSPELRGREVGGGSLSAEAGQSLCAAKTRVGLRLSPPPHVCRSSSSRFLFRHGEILAVRWRRCLFPCISDFAFALFWLFGELNNKEIDVVL